MKEEKLEEGAEGAEETTGAEEMEPEECTVEEIIEVTKEKLVEAVRALNVATWEDEENDATKMLIEKKVKFVGIKTPDIEQAFIEACNSIPEDREEFVPDVVGIVYNSLVAKREAAGAGAAPAEETKPAEVKPKKEKPKKEKAEGGEKKSPFGDREKDQFGNLVGSMKSAINKMLLEGATKDDMVKAICKEFSRDKEHAEGKVSRQMKKLEKAGHAIKEDGGIFKIAE